MLLNSILLVDDDNICNFIHKKIIQRLEVTEEISVAFNGIDALNKLKEKIKMHQRLPQLIFVDLKMPVMDGYEFLKKLHEEYPKQLYKTVIVVLTTSSHPKDVERISQFKNITHFPKPLTEEKFLYIHTKYFARKKNNLVYLLKNYFIHNLYKRLRRKA